MTSGSAALGHVRDRVDRALQAFLTRQHGVLLDAGQDLLPGAESIAGLLAGGKRLRPAFCYWGFRGAGGPDCPEIINAAAALELLHAGALVHDDLMDASDTRRGQPSLHRQFEARHAGSHWHGSPAAFGMGAAILMGDLLLCWTDEMFHASGLSGEALRQGRPVLDRMRTEVFAGQYLDLLGQATGDETLASALRVMEFKTAKYTIERPLHLGAALAAGCDAALAAAYTAYGLPLGLAFQLRDDILGVFGDPAQTGKPAGDDVREGKRTVLLAIARDRATAGQAQVIDRYLGDPALVETGTAEVRAAIAGTGALAECEQMIDRHVSEAVAALAAAPITGEAREALAELAVAATARDG
ncbi:MAG TPA: polyprenyl synthetase family protein [Streptosporangiaceae bacterium]|jgi:geranylgeranyl diphosphate synthase type I|nr:polyprenyl synthetase family protein [Streptosporangiaceae bacterium]